MAMIQTRALTKRYGGIVAVDNLSFDVAPGKVTALLGPNGAGKSTALRLMLDLERGGGETLFDGRRYRGLSRPARVVGACFGPAGAHPGRKVRAHLSMLAAGAGVARARVDEVLDLVGLTPVAGCRARVLSAGALGRLALAGALLGDPDTLILDEPGAGLDPQGVRWLRDFLRAYADQGRTVLVAGHILAETARCADRVLVISRGRLVADERAADFLRRGVREGVSVRTPQIARLSELLRAEGVHASRPGGTTLTVTGADRARVGEIAFRGGVLLHELAEREPGIGDAFTELITHRRHAAADASTRRDAEAPADTARGPLPGTRRRRPRTATAETRLPGRLGAGRADPDRDRVPETIRERGGVPAPAAGERARRDDVGAVRPGARADTTPGPGIGPTPTTPAPAPRPGPGPGPAPAPSPLPVPHTEPPLGPAPHPGIGPGPGPSGPLTAPRPGVPTRGRDAPESLPAPSRPSPRGAHETDAHESGPRAIETRDTGVPATTATPTPTPHRDPAADRGERTGATAVFPRSGPAAGPSAEHHPGLPPRRGHTRTWRTAAGAEDSDEVTGA